jgi:hypothetical protein
MSIEDFPFGRHIRRLAEEYSAPKVTTDACKKVENKSWCQWKKNTVGDDTTSPECEVLPDNRCVIKEMSKSAFKLLPKSALSKLTETYKGAESYLKSIFLQEESSIILLLIIKSIYQAYLDAKAAVHPEAYPLKDLFWATLPALSLAIQDAVTSDCKDSPVARAAFTTALQSYHAHLEGQGINLSDEEFADSLENEAAKRIGMEPEALCFIAFMLQLRRHPMIAAYVGTGLQVSVIRVGDLYEKYCMKSRCRPSFQTFKMFINEEVAKSEKPPKAGGKRRSRHRSSSRASRSRLTKTRRSVSKRRHAKRH